MRIILNSKVFVNLCTASCRRLDREANAEPERGSEVEDATGQRPPARATEGVAPQDSLRPRMRPPALEARKLTLQRKQLPVCEASPEPFERAIAVPLQPRL